jgi:hypothetical protein
MAPPAVLASSSGPAVTTPPKAKETQEIHEKYRKLKRRFFELEEVSVALCPFLYLS